MNVVLPSPRGLVCDGRFPEWDAEERQLRILPVFRLFFSSGFSLSSPHRRDVSPQTTALPSGFSQPVRSSNHHHTGTKHLLLCAAF